MLSSLVFVLVGLQTANAFPWMAGNAPYSEVRARQLRDMSIQELRAEHGDLKEQVARAEIPVDAVHGPHDERDLVGGILGGILKPLTGILQGLDIPTPQPQGLKEIPGDDPLHQFQKPGPTDVRGLCPTMNTLANHGYISRTGITTFAEASNAQQTAFGVGYDVSIVLSLLGLIAGGDLLSGKYSIGGPDSRVPSTLGPAHGINQHGRFECDGSPTRQDAYFGDDHTFQPSRFEQIVNISKKYDNKFNEQTMHESRVTNYQQSKETNPNAFFGPGYLIVSAATHFFWYRLLANGTTPDDANYANVAPFYHNETFPFKWFRRADAYTVPAIVEDVLDYVVNAPVELGQNQGIDNFVPFTMDIPRAPEEMLCFIFNTLLTVTPQQFFSEAIGTVAEVMDAITTQILTPLIGNGTGGKCNVTASIASSGSGGGIYDGQ